MTKVALRGLAQRKLRGVRDRARDPARRRVHRRQLRPHGHDQPLLRRHLRRGLRGHRRRGLVEHHGPGRERRPAAVLGALPRPGAARARRGGRRGRHLLARALRGREGRPAEQQLRARVHQLHVARAVRDAHLHRGPAARRAPTRPRSTSPPRTARSSTSATRSGSPARPGSRGTGSSASSGSATPRRGGSGTAQLTLPEAQRITDKRGELDGISIKAAPGVTPRELRQRIDRVLPARLVVETGNEAAARQAAGHQGRPLVLPRGAARVRRRGAAGGQLPDLQHLLDHGRPADPRVRAAAHARREPPPDPRRDDPRGAVARRARRGSRRAGRHRLRRGPRAPSSRPSASTCPTPAP